jgi:hypothetical protein
VSTVNYAAGTVAKSSNVIVGLADHATYPETDLSVYAYVQSGGSAHVVVDVTGYFQ